MSYQPVFNDRQRAEAFGAVADDYDRYRSPYPDALIDDLVDVGAERVLDVACGTGKLAVPLLACGLAVLGVEIDPAMAEVARRHGIIVDVSSFEDWDDQGRTFDLITCGQAWHWIDPQRGNAKAARLLNPGGTLALCWNHDDLGEDLQREFDDVIRRHDPDLVEPVGNHDEDEAHLAELRASGVFDSIEVKRYRWHATVSTDEWTGQLATLSKYLRLPDDKRAAVLADVAGVVDAHGGSIDTRFGTYTIFARVAP